MFSSARRIPPDFNLFPYTTLFRSGLESARRVRLDDGAPARRGRPDRAAHRDRKSTRLNSSHQIISYAVFCLKKKRRAEGAGEGADGDAIRAGGRSRIDLLLAGRAQ